jgi:lysophospholipase L1-like esterase
MADATDQARAVVERGAEYVTILLGANDVCASSGRPTPITSFASDLDEALTILETGLPDARILVASIPNVLRLWTLFHRDPVARLAWRVGGVCRPLLDPAATWLDRARVFAREVQYNLAIAEICGRHPRCTFDGFAVFRHRFDRDEVSALDYFHPSLDGQNALAELTWGRAPPNAAA